MENIYWSLLSFYNRDTLMRGACVLCFWFYAAVNVFFFLEYIGFMIDPENFWSGYAYDHVRPFLFSGYHLVLILANGLFGLFLLKCQKNRTLIISGMVYLIISFLAEMSESVGVFLIQRELYYPDIPIWLLVRAAGLAACLLLFVVFLVLTVLRPGKSKCRTAIVNLLVVMLLFIALASVIIAGRSHIYFYHLPFIMNDFVMDAQMAARYLRVLGIGLFAIMVIRHMKPKVSGRSEEETSPEHLSYDLGKEIVQMSEIGFPESFIMDSCGRFISDLSRIQQYKWLVSLFSDIGRMYISLILVKELYGLNGSEVKEDGLTEEEKETLLTKAGEIDAMHTFLRAIGGPRDRAIFANEINRNLEKLSIVLTDKAHKAGISEEELWEWVARKMYQIKNRECM